MAATTTKITRTTGKTVLGLAALSMIAGIAATLAMQSAPSANAAPVIAPVITDAAPLTISRKPARDLAPGPGIRLAKVSNNDGGSCFRASRYLAGQKRTISETFCSH